MRVIEGAFHSEKERFTQEKDYMSHNLEVTGSFVFLLPSETANPKGNLPFPLIVQGFVAFFPAERAPNSLQNTRFGGKNTQDPQVRKNCESRCSRTTRP